MSIQVFKHIIFIIFVFIQINILGQNYKIHSEYISSKQGLSNNFVNDIIQDKEGFIWIATKDGLNRYDGHKFDTFRVNADNPNGLNSNDIYCLAEDKQGNIWISNHIGLAKWNRKTGKITSVDIIINHKPVSIPVGFGYILCDKKGNIWVSSSLQVFMYDMLTKKWKQMVKFETSLISHLKEIEIRGKKEVVMVEFLRDHRVLHIFDSQKDRWDKVLKTELNIKYISQKGEVFLFNPRTNTQKTKLYQDKFSIVNIPYTNFTGNGHTFAYNKIANRVLLVEGTAILELNLQTKKIDKVWHRQLFANPMADNDIRKVFVDKSQNLWVYGNGIALLPFKNLESPKTYNTAVRDEFKFRANSIRGIYQDKYGRVWTSGYGNINTIFIFDKNEERKELKLEGAADVVYKIVTDPTNDNYVYLASEHLYKIDVRTLEVVKKYDIEQSKIINLTFLEDEKILSIAKRNYFLLLNLKTGKAKKLSEYKRNEPTYIYQDTQKQIWLGFTNYGIGLLNPEINTMQYFAIHKNKQVSSRVFCIYEDSKNRFWVGTNLGLSLMNRKTRTFTHFTEEDGLANNTVYGILEDKKGNLWLSTNKGISKFNPETEQFINFDTSDGLQDNEFNSNAFYKNEKTEEMFFGGIAGLNSFYPEKMKKNNYVPPIVLTGFKRKGKNINLGKTLSEIKQIEMNYDEAQTLTFEFISLNYFQSHKNRYAYKIEEIHKDWISLGRRHELTLTNLNAGTYTLRIKGSNNDGLWNEKGLTITLIVHPPFWQTWWFLGLVAILFMSMIYAFYRFRIYQIRKREIFLEKEVDIRTEEIKNQAEEIQQQNEELNARSEQLLEANNTKDRLFSIISHDLRSPLLAFQGINKQIKYFTKKQKPEKIEELAEQIAQSSDNLNSLLNNLLNWAMTQQKFIQPSPKALSLNLMVNSLFELFETNAKEQNIQLIHNISADRLIESDENMLSTILRNLISNALKFTPKDGIIKITYQKTDTEEIISVSDTGIGMNEEKLNSLFKNSAAIRSKGLRGEKGIGMGLQICYDLAKLLDYQLKVESIENQGSSFYLVRKLS